MTKIHLLESLKTFTEGAVKDVIMPVRMQKNDTSQPRPRSAKVWLQHLMKIDDAQKVAPYIIHQVVAARDWQATGERTEANADVATVFCVYNEDGQEGSLMLLNLVERLRVAMIRQQVVADQYKLDMSGGMDFLYYREATYPYYGGEMVTTWRIPSINREVGQYVN